MVGADLVSEPVLRGPEFERPHRTGDVVALLAQRQSSKEAADPSSGNHSAGSGRERHSIDRCAGCLQHCQQRGVDGRERVQLDGVMKGAATKPN